MPDVVHVAGWLDARPSSGRWSSEFRAWAVPPAGLRHPRVPTGHLMTVQSVCLGWHWQPYAYSPDRRRHRRRAGEAAAAPTSSTLARAAVADTFGAGAGARYAPDAAIVNLYAPGARLGLHQDGEEPSAAPVVTISLGDTCVFRLAGVDRRTEPVHRRRAAQSATCWCSAAATAGSTTACPKVLDGTGPDGLGLPPGRLSITVRETGL